MPDTLTAMPDDLLHLASGVIAAHDTDRRTITVRLCRWNQTRPVQHPDGTVQLERIERGGIELARDIHVHDRHDGALIGRALPDTYTDTADGPTIDLAIAPTAAGNDLMAQVDAGVITSVSMELELLEARPDPTDQDVTVRTRTRVHGVAFAFRPQLDAPILAVHERHTPTMEEPAMPTDTPTLPTAAPPAGVLTLEEVSTVLDERFAQFATDIAPPADPAHPLAQYGTFYEYGQAVVAGEADQNLLHLALADQISGENPGVMPPSWITDVKGIIERGRPTITAFGAVPAGTTGLEINWPYYDGDVTALVGNQATEKTEITTVKVPIKKGSADLETYAGGSDVSYQLLTRSSPDYLNAYMRIMTTGFNAATDTAAGAAVVAAATAGDAIDLSSGTDLDARVRGALFAMSTDVQAATGLPAEFILVASDVFKFLGAIPGLFPPVYGTQNVSGTAQASTLVVNVSGLPVLHDPYLADGTMIVSNRAAAGWAEVGPNVATAEDVAKLGRNVAVWGLGAFVPFLPAGIIAPPLTLV